MMLKELVLKKTQVSQNTYDAYLRILKRELVPAMGCTEPISIAYATAKAREILGQIPDRVNIVVSGNIIKNVKSVVVPNTNGLKGIEAAAAAGIVAGNAKCELEVLAQVEEQIKPEIVTFIKNTPIKVTPSKSTLNLDIDVTVYNKEESVRLRIANEHTNIVLIEKNGNLVFKSDSFSSEETNDGDKAMLNLNDIFNFSNSVAIEDIENMIKRQIEYNTKISSEGLAGDYGSNIGKILLSVYGDSVTIRAKAKTAAGSDARMSGCELPVVIVSGSGNQGITACVPVVEYAKEYDKSLEKLYRALVLSDLVSVYLKSGIGSLSAFCGALCAACGSGAGIAYLLDGSFDAVTKTIVNAVAILSGMVCDGAKASCAAKIASSVDCAILGYHMYKNKKSFLAGDGIIGENTEETIRNIWRLGKDGMLGTDKEILNIMTGN